MKNRILAATILAVLAVAGCRKADTPAEPATPAVPPPAAVTAAPVADSVSASTGVPECDQYLEKIYACLSDKLPEAQRDMVKQNIEQSRNAWQGSTDKTAIAAQCRTALEQARASFGPMGCSF